ncbi:uncharacterized protein ARMOST_02975 [Armillaria ostoyae]|uniref:Uncharacterized protein n=1 Tax=Armillaria ostoyae TaxID=47428 RepID=A0A284QT62_ARMOS|nr:uncharacterized protein ARMOST_02975 [Armillaria ostoyae]
MYPGDAEGAGVLPGQKRKFYLGEHNSGSGKVPRTSEQQDAVAQSRAQEDEEPEHLCDLQEGENDEDDDLRLRCARYATEMLSSAVFGPILSDYTEPTKETRDNTATLFEGRTSTLKKADVGTPVILTPGKTIFRQPGIIGRDTCVAEAAAEEWKGMETVVKTSRRDKSHSLEKDFMTDVKHAIDKMAKHPPQARLKEYFDPVSYADGDSFEYECRIMMQEKLYPITSLREPSPLRSRDFWYLASPQMGLRLRKNPSSGYQHGVTEEKRHHLHESLPASSSFSDLKPWLDT